MEALPPTVKGTAGGFEEYFVEQGRKEAFAEKNRVTTINMIRKGYADAEICEVLEVTPEYVLRIRAEAGAAE